MTNEDIIKLTEQPAFVKELIADQQLIIKGLTQEVERLENKLDEFRKKYIEEVDTNLKLKDKNKSGLWFDATIGTPEENEGIFFMVENDNTIYNGTYCNKEYHHCTSNSNWYSVDPTIKVIKWRYQLSTDLP